ncbi:MAG: hypothetical protein LBD53_05150 [Tannerella sp.]|jgi:hypothetical protein|nr:hypothetical protein [Tannerella sp.]
MQTENCCTITIEAAFGMSLNAEKNRQGGIKKLDCITSTNGWKVLSSDGGATFREKMKENTQQGVKNLVIFDADKPDTKGGFTTRKADIEAWKALYSLDFELFLFPNDRDDGALEDLLEQIINPQNEPVFDCWNKFENCLPTKTGCTVNPLTVPAKKSKIYAYLEVLHGDTIEKKNSIKDPNRNFKNAKIWDLTAPALKPLQTFLRRYLLD